MVFSDEVVHAKLPAGVIVPAVFVGVGVLLFLFKAVGKLIKEHAIFGVVTAGTYVAASMVMTLLLVDMNNEMLMTTGSDPPNSFPTLDADALSDLWPRMYIGFIGTITFHSFLTAWHRSGMMGWKGKFLGALFKLIAPRAPFLLGGLIVTAIVRKAVGQQAADEGEDPVEASKFKIVYFAWIVASLQAVGVVAGSALLGIGMGQLPKRCWSGTNTQLQNYYKRETIRAQNMALFCQKRLEILGSVADSEKEFIPLSDPAYAVYYSVIRNPADPFYETTTKEEIERDKDIAVPGALKEDDSGEPHSVRKNRLLSNLRPSDHLIIAKMRQDLIETRADLDYSREESVNAEASHDALVNSGRAGFGPKGIAGAVGAFFSAWFGLFTFAYLLFAPFAASKEMGIRWGLWGFFVDPVNTTDGGGKPFWYPVILFYWYICIVTASLTWRRWFYSYSINLVGTSHMGGIMRLTDIWMHMFLPVFYMFQRVVVAWSWEMDDEPDTSFSLAVMDRISVFPVINENWTLWCAWIACIFSFGTVLFNLPGKINSYIYRRIAQAMNKTDASIKAGVPIAGSLAARRQNLAIFGEPIEGETLTAQGEVVSRGGCEFNWSRRLPDKPDAEWIDGALSATYVPVFEDIGHIVAVTVTPAGGGEGAGVTVQTSEKIKVAHPQIRNIRIEGGPFHSSIFAVKGDYVGGVEGRSVIQWYKIKNGITTALPHATDATFQPTVDDVTCMLRVDYTPVREDGVVGELRTAECSPIKIDSVIGKIAKNNIVLGVCSFNVRAIVKGGAEVPGQILVNDKELRILHNGKTVLKTYLGPAISVALDLSDVTLFCIKHNNTEQYNLKADSNLHRDEIALSIRSFVVMSGDKAMQNEAKKLGQR